MGLTWRSETCSARRRRLTSMSVLVTVALLLVVAACGGDDEGAASAEPPPEAAAEPAPEPEPEPAAESDEAVPASDPNVTVDLETPAIQRIDADTGELVATVAVEPAADDIAAIGTDVFVFHETNRTLLRIDQDLNNVGAPIPLDDVTADGSVNAIAGRADSLFVMGEGDRLAGSSFEPIRDFDPETGSTIELDIETDSGFSPVDAFGDVWWVDATLSKFPVSTLVRYADGGLSPTATIPLDREEFPTVGSAIFAVGEQSLWVLTALASPAYTATPRAPFGEVMTLWRIDPDSNEVTDVVEVPIINLAKPTIAIGAGSLWIPDEADATVLQIDQSTGTLQNEIQVGSQPFGAVFANDAVWVANGQDGTVSRIAPDTLEVTTTTVGGAPTGIVTTGDSVWVSVRP
jgi:hypothetical protein